MAELFYMGGPLFMGILTTLLVIMLATSVYFFVKISSGKAADVVNFSHKLTYVKSVGLFTMITGILGQLIGLLDAFKAIERMGDIILEHAASFSSTSTRPIFFASVAELVVI